MAARPIALLRYTSRNLGDDIQTFAVKQFITPDILMDRDRLQSGAIDCDLVLFGWLLQSEQWPPHSQRVHPLSIHASHRSRELLKKHIGWWQNHETVSCRDASTAEFFLGAGVHAAVEGCVTLSLRRWLPPEPGTAVLVDIDAAPADQPTVKFPTVQGCTHRLAADRCRDQPHREQLAMRLLETYQRAELVITSRLHALLPCLAFGTPVVYVENRNRRLASHYSRTLDYMPYVTIWDGQQQFEFGGQLPKNHYPAERVAAITRRLVNIRDQLSK